jgi:site-specific recombinase XerD
MAIADRVRLGPLGWLREPGGNDTRPSSAGGPVPALPLLPLDSGQLIAIILPAKREEILSMQLSAQAHRYLVARCQEGLSPASIEQYRWHLLRLTTWLKEKRGIEHTCKVTRDILREWGANIRGQWSPATCKTAVTACRGLFAWLLEEGELQENPALGLKTPQVPKRIQRTITTEEMRAMLSICDDHTVKGRRDCALLNLLIDTGLRAAEICRLCKQAVDLRHHVITVTVKGGNEELAYFGDSTAHAIRAWLDVRAAAPGVDSLFISVGGGTPGQPLTTRGLRIIVKRIGEQAGVDGVSPHAFRRGFACIATEAGAPSRTVQIAGRWSDIQMVERYTQALRRGGLHLRWSPANHVNDHDDDLDP